MHKDKSLQMHIITQLASGQGIEQGAWRWPTEDAAAFINEDVYIKAAQLAEKAKLDGFKAWTRMPPFRRRSCKEPAPTPVTSALSMRMT